jgi:hypothetical protein
MLEESLDPRPNFQAVLAAVMASGRHEPATALTAELARLWDERQGDWANLRDIRHWLERAR